MGTIIARKRKDGTTAHLAQLLIKRDGAIVHRESRTFDRKQAATAWLEKREKELAKPGVIDRLQAPDPPWPQLSTDIRTSPLRGSAGRRRRF